jgi:hypothetical protein
VNTAQTDAWYEEAAAMDVLGRDWDVGACADLPVEHFYLHSEAAELDSDFADKAIEWREFIYDSEVPGLTLLVIEQSCANGVLLPWDQRGVRLLSAPWEGLLRSIASTARVHGTLQRSLPTKSFGSCALSAQGAPGRPIGRRDL